MEDYKKLTLIGSGNTADVYEIDSTKILKLFKSGMPKEICEMEFTNTKSVGSIISAVPAAYQTVEVDGRFGAVYEKISGYSMLERMTSKLWTSNAQAKLLAKYHSDIQKESAHPVPPVKQKLKHDISSSDFLTEEEKRKVYRYLDALPEGNTLCHFDFHPGNVIIQDGKPVIIDWMTLCYGDKCSDIARTGVILKYHQLPHCPWLVKKLVQYMQNRLYLVYIKEYIKITGINKKDVDQWELPVAAARLREGISDQEIGVLLKVIRKKLNIYNIQVQ